MEVMHLNYFSSIPQYNDTYKQRSVQIRPAVTKNPLNSNKFANFFEDQNENFEFEFQKSNSNFTNTQSNISNDNDNDGLFQYKSLSFINGTQTPNSKINNNSLVSNQKPASPSKTSTKKISKKIRIQRDSSQESSKKTPPKGSTSFLINKKLLNHQHDENFTSKKTNPSSKDNESSVSSKPSANLLKSRSIHNSFLTYSRDYSLSASMNSSVEEPSTTEHKHKINAEVNCDESIHLENLLQDFNTSFGKLDRSNSDVHVVYESNVYFNGRRRPFDNMNQRIGNNRFMKNAGEQSLNPSLEDPENFLEFKLTQSALAKKKIESNESFENTPFSLDEEIENGNSPSCLKSSLDCSADYGGQIKLLNTPGLLSGFTSIKSKKGLQDQLPQDEIEVDGFSMTDSIILPEKKQPQQSSYFEENSQDTFNFPNEKRSTMLDNFFRLETLSKSKKSYLYKCQNKIDGVVYAVRKILNKNTDVSKLNENFLSFKEASNHEHLVKYFDLWEEDCLFVQSELCEQNIESLGLKLNEVQIRDLLKQITLGLYHLHKNKISNVDLSKKNILISHTKKYKIDYSSTKILKDALEKKNQIHKLDENTDYTKKNKGKQDILSLGLLICELMIGKDYELAVKHCNWSFVHKVAQKIKSLSNFSSSIRNLVIKMIDPKPELRPSSLAILKEYFASPLEMELYKEQKIIEKLKSKKKSLEKKLHITRKPSLQELFLLHDLKQ